jgi:hypothetical protein
VNFVSRVKLENLGGLRRIEREREAEREMNKSESGFCRKRTDYVLLFLTYFKLPYILFSYY